QSRTRRPLSVGAFLFLSSVEEEVGEEAAMPGVRTVAGLRARLRLRALFRAARGRLRLRGGPAADQPRLDRQGSELNLALPRALACSGGRADRPGDRLHLAGQGAQPREGTRPRPSLPEE